MTLRWAMAPTNGPRSCRQRFSELFETPVRVFPVATGTAANALALAALGPSWGIVYCSEVAHINTSEANATGFLRRRRQARRRSAGSTAKSTPACLPKRWPGSRRPSSTEASRARSA